MNIDDARIIIGPFMMLANFTATFLCLRPKRGMLFTIGALAVYSVAVHFLLQLIAQHIIIGPFLGGFMALLFLPMNILLFRGQVFQKVFAFFMLYQLVGLLTSFIEVFIGIIIGYQKPYSQIVLLVVSLFFLGVYITSALLFGRRFMERLFVDGRRSEWAVYSFCAVFSYMLVLMIQRIMVLNPYLYIAFILFILWNLCVLCFTIVNRHEKAARAYQMETLLLQMDTMREQTDIEKKYHNDMETLRRGMNHDMSTIIGMFRTGKTAEAETVYAGWQNSLSGTVPAALCAEPMLNAVFSRFKRKAEDMDIRLYVTSNIPADIPVDTIKLSVMMSNALENALTAANKVEEQNKRQISVKLIQNGSQIGMEITNPCAEPVEFNSNGLPVTHNAGHGIGVRSIAVFAEDNDCLLNFSCIKGKFTMQMVMQVDEPIKSLRGRQRTKRSALKFAEV